jgi:ABC-2 type transport system permease protein
MTAAARAVLWIAIYRLVQLGRDKIGLFFTFLLPLLILALLVVAVPDQEVALGVAVQDRGQLATDLRTELEQASDIEVSSYDNANELRTAVRRFEVSAGVVIPPGYDAALRSGGQPTVELVLDQTSTDTIAVRSQVTALLSDQVALAQAAAFAAREGGVPFDQALSAADAADTAREALDTQVTTAGATPLTNLGIAAYVTAGQLVLFLFVIGLTGAGDLVESRRLGITRRMLATPIPTWGVLAGEGLGRLGIALVQALVIVGAGALVFGIDWGNPLGVVAIIAAFSLVVAAVSLLVGAISPTAELATSIGPPIGIVLGMLAGCMWPLEIVPAPMAVAGHFTPHAWAVDAFVQLMGAGATLLDVLTEVGILLAFAAVILAVAVWRLRRSILL